MAISQYDVVASKKTVARRGLNDTRAPKRAELFAGETVGKLAQFRYALRKFLSFSENAARACGVTPQQHQLMLGVAGFTGRGCATVSELAEFLQEKNHSVVGLVDRAVQRGLVERKRDSSDGRVVVVQLTARGEHTLLELSELHRQEIEQIRTIFTAAASKEFSTTKNPATQKRAAL